jgi:hypothetical protein
MANTTFSGPVTSTNGFIGDVTGDITGDVVGLVQVPTYDVAGAPAATGIAGTIIFVSNGLAGAPCLAVSDGTDWISPAGTAIADA